MGKIYEIFKEYKYKLLLIYTFMLIMEVSILFQPFLLGRSIDDLIIGNYLWLIILSISYFMSNFFNYKSMVYDTKVYTEIYNDIVLKFLKKTDVDISTKIARTDMANNIIDVLEGYAHYYISTIITVIGSIWFIYSINYSVGISVSIAFLLILSAVMIYYKKIRQSIKVKHNHSENRVKRLEGGYIKSKLFFERKRKLDIYASTLQGKNWFIVGTIKHTFLIISIVLLILNSENVTIGSVITTYSYVNVFLISLMSIPVGIEMYSRISDILKRL